MCCSLYSEESANVDIAFARTKGITVLGIRDYGDRGVVEYVMYQLIRILHGFDFPLWNELPLELTDLKVGIIGLGVSGGMIADALNLWVLMFHTTVVQESLKKNNRVFNTKNFISS